MRRFIADEHTARQAMYREPDDAWEAAKAQVMTHLSSKPGSIVSLGFGRPKGAAGRALLERPQDAENVHPRVLFLVARHGGDRERFRALVSSPRDPNGSELDAALNIEAVDGDLKIVGKTAVDPFADAELKWEPAGGDQFEDIGPPVEVAKLQKPQNPAHAAHYDAY